VTKHIRPKQVNRNQPRVFTAAEVDRLVRAAVKVTRFAPVIATIAYTGCRAREGLGLRWRDIDHARDLIHFRGQLSIDETSVVGPKTDAAVRACKLVPKLRPALGREARMRAQWSSPDDYCFATATGTPSSYRGLRRALALASKEAGLGHVRAHDLRHSATSILLQHGDLATAFHGDGPRQRQRHGQGVLTRARDDRGAGRASRSRRCGSRARALVLRETLRDAHRRCG
jgi:integrase